MVFFFSVSSYFFLSVHETTQAQERMAPDQTTNLESVTRICQELRDLAGMMMKARQDAGVTGHGMDLDVENGGGEVNAQK